MNRREFLASCAAPLLVLSAEMKAVTRTSREVCGFGVPLGATGVRPGRDVSTSLPPGETSPVEVGPETPRRQLKTYPLHNKPYSADISPDERLVVTQCAVEKETPGEDKRLFADVVQLWNFKENKLIAEMPLGYSDEREGWLGAGVGMHARAVRFSPDGTLVFAQIGQVVHVLRTGDLTELRRIPMSAPPSAVSTYQTPRGRTMSEIEKPYVRAMEVSPQGGLLAVLWVRDDLHGRIDLYEIDSGRRVQGWDTPFGWVYFTSGLQWEPDGKRLVVAIPNDFPCGSPGTEPDIFEFDVETGIITKKLRTGMLTGCIAVAPGNRVLAVDMNCLGLIKNHHPKLKVFDLRTGKHLRNVSGRGSGVRYFVSASADGSRFLAFTGRLRLTFDWLDLFPDSVPVDETFSVWNLKDYGLVAVSQNVPGLEDSVMRMSPKGHFAVSYSGASFVYDLT